MRGLWLLALLLAGLFPFAVFSDDTQPTGATDPVGRHLSEMFQSGYGRGANALKDARRHYEISHDASSKDPRVDYAFGLVLLKQLKNKDALAQFQVATQSKTMFVPAWQAAIWMQFSSKDYSNGYSHLRGLARQLADPASPLPQADREEAAEWIGRVLAALQKSVDTVKQREQLLREDEALKEILGADLEPFRSRGKSGVNSMHALLEDDVQQTREQALAREEKERAEREVQVARDLEASADRREELKKSAEASKKYLDEQLASLDKQLTRLERDYEFLQKRVVSITASQFQINAELRLLADVKTPQVGLPGANLAPANGSRRAFLEAQAIQYQVELDQTFASTMLVSQRAQALVNQRMGAIRQYEKTTGQLVQKDSALDKWQDRLKKDGEKLKTAPKGKGPQVAGKVQQARSFKTYVDLDLNLERDRLLDSYGVAIVAKATDQ
jgi:hypothetical protein